MDLQQHKEKNSVAYLFTVRRSEILPCNSEVLLPLIFLSVPITQKTQTHPTAGGQPRMCISSSVLIMQKSGRYNVEEEQQQETGS
jgi:hypothetical protein